MTHEHDHCDHHHHPHSHGEGGLKWLAICLAVGLGVCGYFIGNTLYKSRVAVNTATVKGLAEQKVKSDLAVWEINFTMEAPQLQDAHAAADEKRQILQKFLEDEGFSDDEISSNSNGYLQEFRDNSGVLKDKKFQVTVYFTIRTPDVEKVEKARRAVGDLMEQGVMVNNNAPSYYYTSLNDIKPKLLQEATQNARLAAKQFAQDAGAKVGMIQSASQGSFSITAFDGDPNYDITDTSSLYKKVRVVTTIAFYLNN